MGMATSGMRDLASLRHISSRHATAVLCVLPALAVVLHMAAGPWTAIACAAAAPLLALWCHRHAGPAKTPPPDADTPRARLTAQLAAALAPGRPFRDHACCMIVRLDPTDDRTAPPGLRAAEALTAEMEHRLMAAVRTADRIERLDTGCFGLVLAPDGPLPLETLMQISTRLQSAIAAPVILAGVRVRMRASVGACRADALTEYTPEALLESTETALMEASNAGVGSLRVYVPSMQARRTAREALTEDVAAALETGAIVAWFQPQISTDTGAVSGFETLARWTHPTRGTLSPAAFLPAVAAAGLSERLGEVMIDAGLEALAAWDAAGFDVQSVGVNLGRADLVVPHLAERVAWQVDRFDLTPDRLSIEVLETVAAASPDDIISLNIAALSALGCGIDLDDFGTGHASITSLQRLKIDRVKIDGSFVVGIESDPDKQRLIATILSMCDTLGLGSLAEGIETGAQHEIVAQLGCGHVQGFGVGRPMPFEQTLGWLAGRAQQHNSLPPIARRSS